MQRAWIWGLVLGWVLWAIAPLAPTLAASDIDAAALFQVHCAGCHAHGGNIIRRGKNLKMRALKRNQRDTVAAIADLITHGKANMSAYRDRLSPAEIEALARYVLEQATANWPRVPEGAS